MISFDEQWNTTARALALLNSAPERFLTVDGGRSMNQVRATLDEVREGFDVVERALLTLGPRPSDEPAEPGVEETTVLYDALVEELYADGPADPDRWREVFKRWAREHPPEAVIPHPGVTWAGIAREWVRTSVGALATHIVNGISSVWPDTDGARAHALERIPQLILLLENGRGAWVAFYLSVLQDDGMPLATEIYHHPTSDFTTRSTIEHNVLPGDMEYILSHAPKTHREPPWRDPE